MGPQSDEYQWFPGFGWRCVYCGSCAAQLGWHFRGASSGFYGLILDRLSQRASDA